MNDFSDPIPRVSVCSRLRSFSHPYVQIIRCVHHRQRRRSSKECYATCSRRFGPPFGTSDRPLPLHWAAEAALRRGLNPRSRSSCPQNFENHMSLPRALSCRATPVRSVFSQIRTRFPSRPVGLLLYPTLFPSCQQALRRSLLLVLLLTERYHLHYSKNSVFHHLCNSSTQGISPLRRSGTDLECYTSGTWQKFYVFWVDHWHIIYVITYITAVCRTSTS
jgi:hypothetical protein